MIPGPLVADLSSPVGLADRRGERRPAARLLVPAGIVVLAAAVVAVVVWGIFLSPFGFKRYDLAGVDRTFTIHEAGTYVVYLEGPGESHPSLPPAVEVSAAALAGQHIDIRPLGVPGVVSAPAAYDVWHYEGRGLAVVTVDRAGTFALHVQPAAASDVDPSRQRVVTSGTVAIGRDVSRTWLSGWWGLAALAGLPVLVGVVLIVVGWRFRDVR